QFASVADDENNLPPVPWTLRKIARRLQNRVIHYPRNPWRSAHRVHRLVNRNAIDDRSLRSQRPTRYRRSIIRSAICPDLVQNRRQVIAYSAEVRNAAHRAAVGVDCHFVEWAEGSLQ